MLKSKNKLLHKALAFVLTFSLLASVVSFNFTASALTGTGTEQTPYEIASLEDLNAFANKVNNGEATNAYAKLTADITINDSWTPIGNGTNKFTGVFDGSNGNGEKYTITFTNISDNTADYVGLFGINEGTIKNVKVAGTITSGTELAFVGGVAGLNRGTITNCENNATINTTGVNSYAGGIAGVMQNGTIESCKNSGVITVHVTNKVTNDVTKQEASAGGIVAFNYNGTVKKCENKADIRNDEVHGYTGGIVGNNDGTINNCLNGGTVSNTDNNGAQYAGGIAGNLFTNNATGSTATIINCLNTNDSGKVVGTNGAEPNNGAVTNSYYKATNDDDNIDGTAAVTAEELKSGKVTYLLNGSTAANPVWGQTIDENNLPMIGATEGSTVYPTTDGGYTNDKIICNDHNYSNGACTVCGDVVAKFSGTSVTLKGEIGFVFAFSVKDTATVDTAVKFTKDGTETSVTAKNKGSDPNTQGYNIYSATLNIDSDQLNLPVTAELSLTYNGTSMTVKSSEMSVNKYLNTLYSNPGEKYAQEIKNVASAMSTYGYYANEYFKSYNHYEPSIPMTELTVTPNELSNYQMTYSANNNSTELKHYATSFQHLETVAGIFYVQGKDTLTVPDGTVMQYTVKKNGEIFKNMQNYIADVTSGATGYNWAVTDKIPVSELKNITFEVTFGNQTSGTYKAQTVTKTYSPYCYIRMTLAGNDKQSVNYKFTQALYHYSEAANTYFVVSSSQS